jgi:hypothetical protein
MPLMSSKMTFFYKRISPNIWFGLLAVFFLIGLLKHDVPFLVVLVIISYQFLKKQVYVFKGGNLQEGRFSAREINPRRGRQFIKLFGSITVSGKFHSRKTIRIQSRSASASASWTFATASLVQSKSTVAGSPC